MTLGDNYRTAILPVAGVKLQTMRCRNETVDMHIKNIANGILCHSQAHIPYKSYVLLAAYIKIDIETYALDIRLYCFNNTRPIATMVGGGCGE